jgi:hypothetical protein
MENGFIDHVNILVATLNYSAIVNLQILQITVKHTHTSVLSMLQYPLVVSWLRLLTVEILQLPRSRHCRLATTP